MYILDTDHVTALQRGGDISQRLRFRLSSLNPDEVFTTIITYEEQTRGWLSYVAKSSSRKQQIQAYQELERHITYYSSIPILSFDNTSALEFERLKKIYRRLGSMDLKIAAITIANQATLLTRNLSDFRQILKLKAEDWTK